MHNLYILRSYNKEGVPLYKLGYSKQVKTRLQAYYTSNPNTELLMTCYLKDGKEIEKIIHSCVRAEWGKEWYAEENMGSIIKYGVNKKNCILYNNFKLEDMPEPRVLINMRKRLCTIN